MAVGAAAVELRRAPSGGAARVLGGAFSPYNLCNLPYTLPAMVRTGSMFCSCEQRSGRGAGQCAYSLQPILALP